MSLVCLATTSLLTHPIGLPRGLNYFLHADSQHAHSSTRWWPELVAAEAAQVVAPHPRLSDYVAADVLALLRHPLPRLPRDLPAITNWPDRRGLLRR